MSHGTVAGTYCGGTLTEILNDELDTNEGGFSRRRVVKGVAWTLPVLVTAVGAPPASASPGPTAPPSGTGIFTSEAVAMVSTGGGGPHNRTGMVVPTKLSLRDLTNVTGDVRVIVSITPQTSPAPTISFSTVKVGTAPVAITRPAANQMEFASALPAGTTTLDFTFSDYSYTGKKQDAATYNVTTTITYIQGGKSVQMTPSPSSTITLPKAG